MELLLLLVLLISIALFVSQRHRGSSSNRLPPGTMGWPVIGENLAFLLTRRCPEKFVKDRMSKYSPQIFKTSLFGESVAFFCDAAGNKFLFSNENTLVKSWWPSSYTKMFSSAGQTSTGTEAKKMRNFLVLQGFLKPESLQRYVVVMDSLAKKHFEMHWNKKQEVTVVPLSKNYSLTLASRLFLGIKDPDQIIKLSNMFDDVAAGTTSFPINFPGTACNRGIKAVRLILNEIMGIIKQREIEFTEKKASVTEDVLSHMMLTMDENGGFISERDIAEKILGILLAGYDTTGSAITSVVRFLAELPHMYQAVLNEQMEIAKSKEEGELLNWEDLKRMQYSWNVACEAMRLSPPAQGTFRQALQDFTYAGLSFPKGWKLHWSTYTTHKNPKYFPDPEKFDPSRFEGAGPPPFSFVPFGRGPRMCPGKEFARVEILVFMHNLATRFKFQKSIPQEKVLYNPNPTPQHGLPVLLHPL